MKLKLIYLEFNPLLKERIEAERWRTEETIKLISLIEQHGNDWDSILKVRVIYLFILNLFKYQIVINLISNITTNFDVFFNIKNIGAG